MPLAKLEDLVFGAWDIFEDSAYEAAMHAGVLEKDLLKQLQVSTPEDQADEGRLRSELRQATEWH